MCIGLNDRSYLFLFIIVHLHVIILLNAAARMSVCFKTAIQYYYPLIVEVSMTSTYSASWFMFLYQVLLLKLPLRNGEAITFIAGVNSLIISSQNKLLVDKQLQVRDDYSRLQSRLAL